MRENHGESDQTDLESVNRSLLATVAFSCGCPARDGRIQDEKDLRSVPF